MRRGLAAGGILPWLCVLWAASSALALLPAHGRDGRALPAFERPTAPRLEPASSGTSLPSGGPATDPRPRGIRPPWREHWIPELRRAPGKPPRKLTAEAWAAARPSRP